ncbi:MAG TPA: DegT/DnrJ/EryC1/StrS family aminotransferase [Chloroflexaceae bacterium]|nr:DegT/DnrJ/EryC1/StrS family aminotransferase [Chloroflexaceae bacterium]
MAGVEPDDEVLMPGLTFVAPANAVRYAGAWPVFFDVDERYWQLDVDQVAAFLAQECSWRDGALRNNATGRRVRALLPVHILGHPVAMDPLLELARRYNLVVIEDATESLGASYKGRPAGALGDIACFSFNGNKLITTGGGGMIVTDNADWSARARYLTTQAKDDPVEYYHTEIGYNYRLTNVLAAFGVAQLERLDDHIARKREIAAAYAQALGGAPGVQLMAESPDAQSVFWMYTILLDQRRFRPDSRGVLRALAEAKIQTRPLWHPIHRLPPFAQCQAYRIEVVDRLYREALSLPCSVGLTHEQQQYVIGELKRQLQ